MTPTPTCPPLIVNKWRDENQDGVKQAAEQMLANWEITVYDMQGNVMRHGFTDANGQITFTGLACQQYRVVETVPPEWEHSTPDQVLVTLAPSGAQVVWFGNYWRFGRNEILGWKFWDRTGNGVWDAGEVGIPGVTIIIRDAAGTEVYRTQTINAPGTPEHGSWIVNRGLVPGIYTVEEVLVSGWVETYPPRGKYTINVLADGTYTIVTPTASELTWLRGLSFGNARPMGYKFYDANGNAQRDAGEPLMGEWQIVLRDMNLNMVYTTATLARTDWRNGYWFLTEPLPAGDYYVNEVLQEGWEQTYPNTYAGIYKIRLNADGSLTLLSQRPGWYEGLNFGNKPTEQQPECPECPEWVVFQTDRQGNNSNIFKMRFDGTEVTQLTDDEAADVSPVYSFDGQRIAFASDRDGDWDIFRMGPDGSGETNVTKFSEAQDLAPSWECYWIAFQTDRDGQWEIYKTDPDGLDQIRLTDNPAADEAPAWSPDGQRIAFQTNRDGNWEIYLMDEDGQNLVRLTENAGMERNPTWSRDGKWIAFESDRDGQFELYKINLETLGQATPEIVRLTDNPGRDTDPVWMPYCEYLFWQTDRDDNSEVYRMSPEGTQAPTQRPVLNLSVVTDTQGQWFDAIDLACVRCAERVVFQSERDGNWEIYTSKFDGSDIKRLTTSTEADVQPWWRYDARQIAYASQRDGNWEIYTMEADGSHQTNVSQMPQGSDQAPSWGCYWIAFQTDRDGDWEIYKMDPTGAVQMRLTQSAGADEWPSWSPDCQWIAFQSERDGNAEIYVMDANGGNVERLTENAGTDRKPTWSPDGEWIVFESNREGQYDLYKVKVATGELVRLTANAGNDTAAQWLPYCDYDKSGLWDGEHIMYTSMRDGNLEVYVMNADGTGQTEPEQPERDSRRHAVSAGG